MSFKYITKEDKTKDLYYKIPKQFLLEKKYKKMKDSAKILYSILYERTNLSISNNWFDEQDRAFIICTYDEIQVLFGCSRDKVSNSIKELEKYNLLKKEKVKTKDGDFKNVLYIGYVETTSETLDTLLDTHKNEYHKLRDKNREYKREYNKKQVIAKQIKRNVSSLQQSEKQTTIENTKLKMKKIIKSSNFNSSPKNRLRVVRKTDYNNTDFNKPNISMYVCNGEINNTKSFVDKFKRHLPISDYALKTLPLFENKIEYELFDKILIDTLNNSKVGKKENYLITKLNKLVQKNILTLDDYLKDVSVFNYKYFESKKDEKLGIKLSDDDIRERYDLEKRINHELLTETEEE